MAAKPDILTAVNNFGLGAQYGEMSEAKSDPRNWVLAHLDHVDAPLLNDRHLMSASDGYSLFFEERRMFRRQRKLKVQRKTSNPKGPKIEELTSSVRKVFKTELKARFKHAVDTRYSFAERWFLFWSNHFTISARDPMLAAMAGAYEREAIRPNIFGAFRDLLHAVTFHPVMLLYLDNDKSIGPNSIVGKRNADKGYNENLAREILELHTMGVDGGYNIDTIKAFALALTGWTVTLPTSNEGRTVFDHRLHEGADVTVLATRFPSQGETQAGAVLDMLSKHPSTAQFIALKIAKHFVGPNPPQTLIHDLVESFQRTNGNLKALAKTLLTHPASWKNNVWQYKTPEEYAISIARAFPDIPDLQDISLSSRLGQAALQASSPEGWPCQGADWINAENLLRRASWLRQKLTALPSWVNTAYLADMLMGHHLSAQTVQSINPAESTLDGHILFFLSPEFMRR